MIAGQTTYIVLLYELSNPIIYKYTPLYGRSYSYSIGFGNNGKIGSVYLFNYDAIKKDSYSYYLKYLYYTSLFDKKSSYKSTFSQGNIYYGTTFQFFLLLYDQNSIKRINNAS